MVCMKIEESISWHGIENPEVYPGKIYSEDDNTSQYNKNPCTNRNSTQHQKSGQSESEYRVASPGPAWMGLQLRKKGGQLDRGTMSG